MARPAAGVLDSGRAMRVLVVEDEEALGQVFRDYLCEIGHAPTVVRTAEAALGALTHERPDAIILDIQLPGMSGLDFLRLPAVRAAGLPVVAVSGVVTESQARECLRLGALDFVGKPVPLDRLGELLAYLEPHALSRRPEPLIEGAERRQAARAPITLPVRITEYRGATWDGTCVELGATGMKARADAALSRGSAVRLGFTPPDGGGPIEAVSLVVRVDHDTAAFVFVNLPPADARRLADLTQRLRRP